MQQPVLDPLTQTLTRASMNDALLQEVRRSQRYENTFSLLIVDVDYLKSVNDAFGHTRGDEVLVELVERVRVEMRQSDLLFRYGGDEFVLLLPSTTSEGATKLAERIAESVRSTPFAGKDSIQMSVSIGLACFPTDAADPQGLFAAADRRLYLSKAYGRDQVIAQDRPTPQAAALQPPERVIERDLALNTLREFLEALPAAQRGWFAFSGEAGSGQTRMLEEARKLARLRGFQVVSLTASLALKPRWFGALLEAQFSPESSLPHPLRAADFAAALAAHLLDKQLEGLVLTVDSWTLLDPATQRFLLELLRVPRALPIGLITTGVDAALTQALTAELPLVRLSPLTPLTLRGLEVFLRQSLDWEAPPEFAAWLHEHSAGFPARLWRTLHWLISENHLRPSAHQWSLREEYSAFPPPSPVLHPSRLPPSLPHPLAAFVGREDEIASLKAALTTTPLITLVGTGGVGKTRLALQIAAESAPRFAHGVVFVPLAPVVRPELFLATLLSALHIRPERGVDPPQAIVDDLRPKHLMLILDNFEHLTGEAPLLARISAECPQVRLLVTSRVRLGLPFEHTHELHGLPIPASQSEQDIELYPSVQVFLHSARRTQPDFQLSPADAPVLVQICRLLDGMPLGLELAAGNLSLLSLPEIAASLQNSLAILDQNHPNLPERHRSLTAVFDTFWNLLSPSEQAALASLAVFQGSFSIPGARAVAGAFPFFLDSLAAKAILLRLPSQRYKLHSALCHYLLIHLRQDAALEQGARQRFAQWCADRLLAAAADPTQPEVTALVEMDIDNLRAAWDWVISQRQRPLLASILPAWMSVLAAKNEFREADSFLTRVDAWLQADPDGTDPALTAQVRLFQGEFAYHLGTYEHGYAVLHQALEYFHTHDHSREAAKALRLLSNMDAASGQYMHAEQRLRTGLEIARQLEDVWLTFSFNNSLGVNAYLQGHYGESTQYLQTALGIAQQYNDEGKQAMCLNNLGNIAFEMGEYARADQLLVSALQAAEPLPHRTLKGSILDSLGKNAAAAGRTPQSAAYFAAALRQLHDIDAQPLALEILVGTAELWEKLARPQAAASLAALVATHRAAQHDVRQRANLLLRRLPTPAAVLDLTDAVRTALTDLDAHALQAA